MLMIKSKLVILQFGTMVTCPLGRSIYTRVYVTQNNVSVLTTSYKSQCPSVDSCSSTSLQSIEDEGNFSISEESESSNSEEKIFYGPENYGHNETSNKDVYDKVQNINSPKMFT
ncbi:hypothetical protein CEXT_271991 [Caerostris extrusa]|uniref:Uncharacterized protein n=1 Tax=Caerostris extrusa TaxID=172846 RepID=A0AAV4UQ99_CAEEX|nr:hypothetical protein CEXT_271991 [Caerostris extrusa]